MPCRRAATYQRVFVALDDRHVHVVGRGREILELLAGENVDGDKMDLGVAVLAGLGGGHVDDLARAVLDHDKPVLPQSRALHGIGGRGTGIASGLGLELVVLRAIELAFVWGTDPESVGLGGCVFVCVSLEETTNKTGCKLQFAPSRWASRGPRANQCGVLLVAQAIARASEEHDSPHQPF